MREQNGKPKMPTVHTDREELELYVAGLLGPEDADRVRALAERYESIHEVLETVRAEMVRASDDWAAFIAALEAQDAKGLVRTLAQIGEERYRRAWIEMVVEHYAEAAPTLLAAIARSRTCPPSARRDASAALVALQLRQMHARLASAYPEQNPWARTLALLEKGTYWAYPRPAKSASVVAGTGGAGRRAEGPAVIDRVALFLDRLARHDPLLPEPPLAIGFEASEGEFWLRRPRRAAIREAQEQAEASFAMLRRSWRSTMETRVELDTGKSKRVSSSSGRGS